MKYLIDTNILVYAYDPADQGRQEKSIRLLDGLRELNLGAVSVQCLAEFFNVIIRQVRNSPPRKNPQEALIEVQFLGTAFEVYNLTRNIVWEAGRAVRDYQFSYYDAQIWATARLNQIPIVLSEDFQSGQILEGVQFINPFDPSFDLAVLLA